MIYEFNEEKMNTTKYALIVIITFLFSFNIILSKVKIDTNYRDKYPPIRYYGEIVDYNGKPIPNVEVMIRCYRDGGTFDSTFKTNKLGKYDFKYNAYGRNTHLYFSLPSKNKEKSNPFRLDNIPTAFIQKDLEINAKYEIDKQMRFDITDSDWGDLFDIGDLHNTLGINTRFKEIKEEKDSIKQLKMYDSIVNYFNNYPLNYKNSSFNDLAKSQIAYTLFWLNLSIGDKIGKENVKHYNQKFFADTLDKNSPVLSSNTGIINNVGSYLKLKDKNTFFSKLINSSNPEVQAAAYKERIKMYEGMKYLKSLEKDTDYFLNKLTNSTQSEVSTGANLEIESMNDSILMQKDIDYVLKNLQFTRGGKDIYYEYDFTRPIKNGKRFIDFKLPLYENELLNDSIDLDKLKGKFVLIDFWATSCPPCIEEMKYLHNAYETFKDSNFTILSITIDSKIESAIKFRNKKWKMPWLNVYAEGHLQNSLLKQLGINGIPQAILINKEGIIIDEGKNLRGKRLAVFLEYMLSINK